MNFKPEGTPGGHRGADEPPQERRRGLLSTHPSAQGGASARLLAGSTAVSPWEPNVHEHTLWGPRGTPRAGHGHPGLGSSGNQPHGTAGTRERPRPGGGSADGPEGGREGERRRRSSLPEVGRELACRRRRLTSDVGLWRRHRPEELKGSTSQCLRWRRERQAGKWPFQRGVSDPRGRGTAGPRTAACGRRAPAQVGAARG